MWTVEVVLVLLREEVEVAVEVEPRVKRDRMRFVLLALLEMVCAHS
jgi:hypothetical protein